MRILLFALVALTVLTLLSGPIATANDPRAPLLQGTGGTASNMVAPPDTLIGEHCEQIYYDFDYIDPVDGDSLVTFHLADGDPGMVDSLTGEYTYQPSYADINTYINFTISVCRTGITCNSKLVWMRLTNNAPVIHSACDTVINTTIGSTTRHTLEVTDCPQDPRDFIILDDDNAQGQLSINSNSGEISFRPNSNDLGQRVVRVGVSDGVDTSECSIRFNVPGQNRVSLDSVVGLVDGAIAGGRQTSFNLRVTVDPNLNLYMSAYSNGFRVYSPDGATWLSVGGLYLPDWPLGSGGFDNSAIGTWGIDGQGDDTVAFAGAVVLSTMGAPPGFSAPSWQVNVVVPQDQNLDGLTLCLDTVASFPPTNPWKWNDRPGTEYFATWDGPHCYPIAITECCVNRAGNINADFNDVVDISDLTQLVNHLFISFDLLNCPAEANVNGDAGCNIDISDLTTLVNYLFVTFQEPAPCISACE